MRFLFPVYFIDEVELTPYTATSDVTSTKGEHQLPGPDYLCANAFQITSLAFLFFCVPACEFLGSLEKSSFSRLPGRPPQKLAMSEVLEIQKRVAATRTMHCIHELVKYHV